MQSASVKADYPTGRRQAKAVVFERWVVYPHGKEMLIHALLFREGEETVKNVKVADPVDIVNRFIPGYAMVASRCD